MTAKQYTHNTERKVYNIDFDGVITLPDCNYTTPTRNEKVIQRIKELYFSGNIIIIWSARLWSDASWLAGWLIQNEVPFHGLMLGKGGSDVYVDDKVLNVKNF